MADLSSTIASIGDIGEAPMRGMERGLEIGEALNRRALTQLDLGQKSREQKEQKAADEILKTSDYTTPKGVAETAEKLKAISPRISMDFLKTAQQYQTGKMAQEEMEIEMGAQRLGLLATTAAGIANQAQSMTDNGESPLAVRAYITREMTDRMENLKAMQLSDGRPVMPPELMKLAAPPPGGYTLDWIKNAANQTEAGRAQTKAYLDEWRAKHAGEKVEPIMRGGKPHKILFDSQGREIKDLGEAPPTAQTAAAASAGPPDMQRKIRAIRAYMSDNGISFPSGMRSKQAQNEALLGELEIHPDQSPQQIVARMRSGALKYKGEQIALGVVERREGSAAAAINSLNREGGLYDQALEVGKNVDFSGNKVENAWRLWKQGEAIADPDLSEYINVLADTRAEFASVLARGGQITDSVRLAAEHAFPDKMSYTELQRNVARSKKVAASIQEGNTSVADALIQGKSLADVLKEDMATRKDNPPAAAPGGKRQYQHPSGATVEILEE